MENWKQLMDLSISNTTEMVLAYTPKLLLAIFTLTVGIWLINKLSYVVREKIVPQSDPTLGQFLGAICSVTLKTLLLVAVASMIGIETTSFVAVIGAAGLAIGLALRGSLSNFAGGVLILIFKPFRVDEVIESQGYIGTVKEIQLFNTRLKTADNRTIFIPNADLANKSLINISREPTRRVDFSFSISYEDSIKQARAVILGVLAKQDAILDDPEPLVAVIELADSSVDLTVRVWVNRQDYWDVFFSVQEEVKETLELEGITIPYPQRDVRLKVPEEV